MTESLSGKNPEEAHHSIPEFMRSFDANMGKEEKARAEGLFVEMVDGALLAHSGEVQYMAPELLGDRAPNLRLVPFVPRYADLQSAQVAKLFNGKGQEPSQTCVVLSFLRPDGKRSIATYKTDPEGGVVRYYIDDVVDHSNREADDRLTMGYEGYERQREASAYLERQLGVNNCHVSAQEVEELGQLLAEMMPENLVEQ